jgi:hypothetical protein
MKADIVPKPHAINGHRGRGGKVPRITPTDFGTLRMSRGSVHAPVAIELREESPMHS